MIISNCPRCQEQYRIPMGVMPEDAYAQCPWCHETFSLEEAMRRLPPVLRVIGADGQDTEQSSSQAAEYSTAFSEPNAAGHVASDHAPASYARGHLGGDSQKPFGLKSEEEGDEFNYSTTYDVGDESSPMRIEASDDDEIDPEFVIHDSSGSEAVGPMRVQSAPSVSGAVRRKKKGSPLKTLLGIALGPVIAIPAAGAILLGADYLGFITAPNLGVWPMDGSYSSNASTKRTAAAPMPSSEQSDGNPSMSSPPTGRSLGEDLGTEATATVDPAADALAQLQSSELSTTQQDLVPTTPTAEPQTPEITTPEITLPDLGLPKALAPVIEPPNVDSSVTTDANSDTIPDATSATEIEMPNVTESSAAPQPTASITSIASPELITARKQATEMLDKIASFSGSDAERKPLLVNTYISIAELGSLLDPSSASAVTELVDQLKQNDSLLDDLARATPQWLNLPPGKRPNDGVIVVGDLDTTGASPTVRLANDSVVTVQADDAATIASGRVLGLGKIIDGPVGQTVNLSIVESL